MENNQFREVWRSLWGRRKKIFFREMDPVFVSIRRSNYEVINNVIKTAVPQETTISKFI